MSEEREKYASNESEAHDESENVCKDIKDPVRRGLCKVCGLPVIGEAPFCKDHELPVP